LNYITAESQRHKKHNETGQNGNDDELTIDDMESNEDDDAANEAVSVESTERQIPSTVGEEQRTSIVASSNEKESAARSHRMEEAEQQEEEEEAASKVVFVSDYFELVEEMERHETKERDRLLDEAPVNGIVDPSQ
jgi:hypothetical protein